MNRPDPTPSEMSHMTPRELADHIARAARALAMASAYLKEKPGHQRSGSSMETAFARLAIKSDDIAKREATR